MVVPVGLHQSVTCDGDASGLDEEKILFWLSSNILWYNVIEMNSNK